MTTPAQIRAARALLGLSVDQVSAKSGVSAFMILQIEDEKADSPDQGTLLMLRGAFEKAGIAFLGDGDCPPGGMGVRLVARHDTGEGLRPENLNATNDG
ncbi:helix-turn-helix domain-containing protein [Rhizobium arsenicireducens]|jgi:transcriptional regulator with XRE-family HTH domain